MQILNHTATIHRAEPREPRAHRHNGDCITECSFCQVVLCREDDTYEFLRVGDSGDFIRRCETCQDKHARGEMEEAV